MKEEAISHNQNRSVKTRFKPGQSGNPKGRPKGSKSRARIIEDELNALITVSENGKRIRITKLQAAIRQQANKAAGGDLSALKAISDFMLRFSHQNPSEPLEVENKVDFPSTPEDAYYIYMEMIKK